MSNPFSLKFITEPDAPMRRDQYILVLLWDQIKRENSFFDDEDLAIIEDAEPLTTRGNFTYWYGGVFSDNPRLAQAVAAFNALRGRIELVFQDEEHYQDALQKEKIRDHLEELQNEEVGESEEVEDEDRGE